MTDEPAAPDEDTPMRDDTTPDEPKENIVHFNPWRDFNDAAPQIDVFGDEPDPEQIAQFMQVVFGYCDGLIPVRSFIDKGQGIDGRPHNIWLEADQSAPEKMATFATWASREGAAVYVIPGTVAAPGQAKAAEILQMQTVVVDLDTGDIAAKRAHLERHLGAPTMVVESGGVTPEGQRKAHVWWTLTEPAEGDDIARVCRLRGDIAAKVGGDMHFRSAHQPIRVAGSVYYKNSLKTQVRIVELNAAHECDLAEFIEAVTDMPPVAGVSLQPEFSHPDKPEMDDVLVTPVREGAQDDWSRFEGASAAIGHFIRMVHEGRMTKDEGWEGICGYNAAMLRPQWPVERLKRESERLWDRHVEKYGPPLIRLDSGAPVPAEMPAFTLGSLLDDQSPMPEDIIAPRVLTPGGLLVLGGAPKVGKSDLLISWLVHMAAGVPFLGFTPPRPLRIFYLQAEIQYHYLRERLKQIALAPEVLTAARDTFVATPKLKMLLDNEGSVRVARAVQTAFPDAPPDILCVDPIRNLFDGGPDGGGENDNTAMMFFLKERIEVLRDHIDPDCGVILIHHTKKLSKQQVKDDPFLALSGASALRGFYTSGLILHRPDEEAAERKLEIELRNGPALPPKLIDKVGGQWVELNPMNERLVRQDIGAKHDAERDRKRDVILSILIDEAAEGKLYTSTQFREAFENQRGLGSQFTIRDRINVLATKGLIRFLRDGTQFGHTVVRSRFGYLCAEGMVFGRKGRVDPETGEVLDEVIPVVPSHYKSPSNGQCMDLEDPSDWSIQEGENA
ncbi:AAA family ATPase [Ponticoccus sp. SC2-23]|nr:AAA family ATPase [Ponticoccus sp. SC6-9]MBM1231644.1 AAA family ATPase [Ponticoccus sp. SC6-38]MBM1236217.1 AAA family ATPase [Ponticoccus sp. SC6-45]MBM1240667.1 AAA family ATPase [Ponticoccus sp. SC6-49]MBM1245202.1 AAA family ATPase [Ponticoccus sp. SC2-64]MBM1249718.1 AAA family ATPase [Ponticoccus sp. SC6-42]MBM1254166.1 AAA family ATPase [Ponticoccus sp. SC6-33]MBM1258680.1 AAA family ATPase [Ponticoccus sp. SC6-60]MBM1263177.1 AAA family ATPase [Ponticoccus sp. SC6-31]MBM1267702